MMTPEDRADSLIQSWCPGLLTGDRAALEINIIKHLKQSDAEGYRRGRSEADELFVLDVECEYGSRCRKDRTCSGVSHWLTVKQLEERGYRIGVEEAADIATKATIWDGGVVRAQILNLLQRSKEGGK